MPLLNSIKFHYLNVNEYHTEDVTPTQIYLHHTAGNANPIATVKWWNQAPAKIATHFIIGGKQNLKNNINSEKDGQIVQCMDLRTQWASHLGVGSNLFKEFKLPYRNLDKRSVGIEICNWGQLTYDKNEKRFENYVGGVVPNEEVITLSKEHRGFKHWHTYTDAQIASTKELLGALCEELKIPTGYKGDSVFGLYLDAYKGVGGIYTHCSVRKDKADVYPHPQLVEMLKSL